MNMGKVFTTQRNTIQPTMYQGYIFNPPTTTTVVHITNASVEAMTCAWKTIGLLHHQYYYSTMGITNKRSKNFEKRPNRRQKIHHRSQDRGKAVNKGLSVGKVVQVLLYGKNAISVSREYVRHA